MRSGARGFILFPSRTNLRINSGESQFLLSFTKARGFEFD